MNVIVVLGSAGRIGNSLVSKLSNSNNIIVSIDKTKHKSKNQILKNLYFFKCNITNHISLNSTLLKILKKFKKIDSVINATYPKTKKWPSKFTTLDPIDLKNNLYLQLGTSIIIAKILFKIFEKQKYGNIVFISSIQGLATPKFEHYNNTTMSSPIEYSAIKAGIISITKYLAKYSKNKNIRINCIVPGGILDNQPKIFLKKYKSSCLSKGMLDSDDIVGTVEFLTSDKSKYINGQAIVIDDGWSL